MKQNSRGVVIIAILIPIILLALGAVGYFVYQNTQLRKTTNPRGATTTTPQSSEAKMLKENCEPCPQYSPPAPNFCSDGTIIPATTDECDCQSPPSCQRNGITWLTYTNTKYDYTLSYPSNWYFYDTGKYNKEYVDSQAQFEEFIILSQNETKISPPGGPVPVYKNALHVWTTNWTHITKELFSDTEHYDVEDVSLNGYSALKVIKKKSYPDAEDSIPHTTYYIKHKNFWYLIFYDHKNNPEDTIEIINQILSTFQFLD